MCEDILLYGIYVQVREGDVGPLSGKIKLCRGTKDCRRRFQGNYKQTYGKCEGNIGEPYLIGELSPSLRKILAPPLY